MNIDFSIPIVGTPNIHSPITMSKTYGDKIVNYVHENEKILYNIRTNSSTWKEDGHIEVAGPREYIYYSPSKVKVGIVTCGGLCPGLNNVIRSIVYTLCHEYSVSEIYGIRFGFNGFLRNRENSIIRLSTEQVENIHWLGGSILGTSRGGGNCITEIVDSIEKIGLNILFTIGGDGTQRGALNIAQEIKRRRKDIAVIGIPKTIDNDLSFIDKSFGFETAVAKATEVLLAAHQEAHSVFNGIGLVKLMGRESGFIAAHTALASHEANYVLIPEIPFRLEGDNGLLEHLEKRLRKRHHALIVVAEGAGQELLTQKQSCDESGNAKLGDIGIYLKKQLLKYFTKIGYPINLKYIDPSYIIRSVPAIPNDGLYCSRLGTNAVHAAMAGKTSMIISCLHNCFVHIPMALSTQKRNRIDPESSLWRDVLETTKMPLNW